MGQKRLRQISIHALLTESDINRNIGHGQSQKFLSTLSLRRATFSRLLTHHQSVFLSTLSLRRATVVVGPSRGINCISIHALLTESDRSSYDLRGRVCHFYPRSPYGERPATSRNNKNNMNFYPRSPYGERRPITSNGTKKLNFYPRSPYGERLQKNQHQRKRKDISIHALLTESDYVLTRYRISARYFYPRSPYGERLSRCKRPAGQRKFLSTLSLRRATVEGDRFFYYSDISIHALLTESDENQGFCVSLQLYFYPRSPYGERHGFCEGGVSYA